MQLSSTADLPACYALCAPDGPNTPFAFPTLFLTDILRICIMLLGVAIIVLTPRLVLSSPSKGQKARLLGQGIFALIVIGTEVDHIGDYMHYRLVLTLIGVSVMWWGLMQLKRECPPTHIDESTGK
jgi:hypothetical protein